MTRIKICGITNTEDAMSAQNAGAHALGFVFYKKSKRYTDPLKVREIVKQLNPFIAKIGVFVNETAEEIMNIYRMCGLTHVQLHGDENRTFADQLHLPIIKAINYSGTLKTYIKAWSDLPVLIDNGNKINPGGTGHTLSWEKIADEIDYSKIILAGGLTPENVRKAISILHPAAVDVSSGVEKEPGKKDVNKIIKFIEQVKTSELI